MSLIKLFENQPTGPVYFFSQKDKGKDGNGMRIVDLEMLKASREELPTIHESWEYVRTAGQFPVLRKKDVQCDSSKS
jgi:hypothetical protein